MASSNDDEFFKKLEELGVRRRSRKIKCIAYPNRRRKRVFTPKKVGAIVCELLRGERVEVGQQQNLTELRRELRHELNRCFPCDDQQDEKQSTARSAVAAAMQAIRENSTVIAIALSVLLALLVVPRLIGFLPVVALRLLPVVARTALTQIPGIIARLRTQQAANADLFRKLANF